MSLATNEVAYPITSEQADLITTVDAEHRLVVEQAQRAVSTSAARLNALIAGILAGHGVIEGTVMRVEPGDPPQLVVVAPASGAVP